MLGKQTDNETNMLRQMLCKLQIITVQKSSAVIRTYPYNISFKKEKKKSVGLYSIACEKGQKDET